MRGLASGSSSAAVALMVLAVALFALLDAGLKWLAPHYPAAQVAAMRCLAGLPWILLWVVPTVGLASMFRVRWRLHLLRGVLGIAMMVGFVHGLRDLPLSTAYALAFVAPFIVTVLAGPLLGEQVGRRRWIAVAIGLAGVLVVLRPTGDGLMTLGALAILGSAVCYAGNVITVRILAGTDSNQALVFWLTGVMAIGSLALAWPGWVPIRPQDLPLIVALGIVGLLAQIALNAAFRRGEASAIVPLEYTALIWSTMLDATLWGVLPDCWTWVGAAIIVAGGLYLLGRDPRPPSPAAEGPLV